MLGKPGGLPRLPAGDTPGRAHPDSFSFAIKQTLGRKKDQAPLDIDPLRGEFPIDAADEAVDPVFDDSPVLGRQPVVLECENQVLHFPKIDLLSIFKTEDALQTNQTFNGCYLSVEIVMNPLVYEPSLHFPFRVCRKRVVFDLHKGPSAVLFFKNKVQFALRLCRCYGISEVRHLEAEMKQPMFSVVRQSPRGGDFTERPGDSGRIVLSDASDHIRNPRFIEKKLDQTNRLIIYSGVYQNLQDGGGFVDVKRTFSLPEKIQQKIFNIPGQLNLIYERLINGSVHDLNIAEQFPPSDEETFLSVLALLR
ncbi:MAG: hypothetical protein ACT4O3_06325 [Elusimicrobiota bacterium]